MWPLFYLPTTTYELMAVVSQLTEVDVELDSQLVRDPLQEAPDTRNAKDEKARKKDNSEGVETTLQRRPSESSSLRDFLDGPAIAPIGGAADPADQLYVNFFNNSLPDAPPQVDEPPKRRLSRFLGKFTRKKKGRGAETQTQPEPQQAGAGAGVDPLSTTTPKEPTAKDKGKQKEIDPDAAPAEEIERTAISTPGPIPAASATHTKHKIRHRVKRIRQVIMPRRDGSTASEYDHLEVVDVAYGHMDDRVATAKSIPRKRWKGNLKKKEENAQAAEPSTVATTSQQADNDSDDSDADEAVVSDDEEVAAAWYDVLFNLICYCNRDRYISVDDSD
ncbi:hypothetical protein PAXINDRAFT_17930 [Paxillus involutus ATCC 200175]|uniref:Uncharacterized protein n=1 Tax=Paxillus involutus ATCC 200175 TaxID=664439 RepID=A0A0C9SPG4_PAXIN|nr:hypothetical protein PAXINDRAFT_17930 [Paxillus involutus ATCC 200175]